MIKALAHVCVLVDDLERTRAFYGDTLGLKPHFNLLKDGQLFGFYLQIGPRQFLEFFKAQPDSGTRDRRVPHFCFEVDDLDAVREKLARAGVEVTPKKLGCDQTWQCWCKDPDGVDIEFQQYTGQSAQFTKADCVVNW